MSETIMQAVKDKYGAVATSGLSSNHEGVKAVAQAFQRAGGTRLHPRRGEHGSVLRRPEPPSPACGKARWSWTWAAVAGSICCWSLARAGSASNQADFVRLGKACCSSSIPSSVS